MRMTCQNFNFQLEKTARQIVFFYLGSNPGCMAEWNIQETEGSQWYVLYSILHFSVAAAGRLAAMLCSSFVSVSGASASASASI